MIKAEGEWVSVNGEMMTYQELQDSSVTLSPEERQEIRDHKFDTREYVILPTGEWNE